MVGTPHTLAYGIILALAVSFATPLMAQNPANPSAGTAASDKTLPLPVPESLPPRGPAATEPAAGNNTPLPSDSVAPESVGPVAPPTQTPPTPTESTPAEAPPPSNVAPQGATPSRPTPQATAPVTAPPAPKASDTRSAPHNAAGNGPTAGNGTTTVGQTSNPEAAAGKEREKDDFEWTPPPIKHFSAAERAAECRKYEGKLIAYYSHIYLVQKCKRREVDEGDQIHVNTNDRVITVEADTIIKIAEGSPLGEDRMFPAHKRGCKELEGRFVLEGASDIYLVEKCKRRPFADYETLEAYQAKRKKSGAVLELSPEEFAAIPLGKEIPSVLDGVYKNLLEGRDGNADLLPIDEACRGVNGKLVSFYSRLYKVQKCQKREINPQIFFSKRANANAKIVELSSSQWLSLPDGKPLDNLDQVD